jgi:hypothetical protein
MAFCYDDIQLDDGLRGKRRNPSLIERIGLYAGSGFAGRERSF